MFRLLKKKKIVQQEVNKKKNTMTVMVMVMLTTKIHKYQILDTHVLDRVKKRD